MEKGKQNQHPEQGFLISHALNGTCLESHIVSNVCIFGSAPLQMAVHAGLLELVHAGHFH